MYELDQIKGNNQENTESWYEEYYRKKGKYRNSLLSNPEVLFQTLAYDVAVISALRSTKVKPENARVFDIGCGGGGSLVNCIRLGFDPSNLFGIDILEERISKAREIFPSASFIHGDAADTKFSDQMFDIVTESMMFVQLIDDKLASKIANEMIRVTKTNGYIVIVDWRYSKPWDRNYKGLSIKRLKMLFQVGSATKIHRVYKAALVPPLGRFISKRIPFLYFMVQTFLPFLVGQVAVVLQKIK